MLAEPYVSCPASPPPAAPPAPQLCPAAPAFIASGAIAAVFEVCDGRGPVAVKVFPAAHFRHAQHETRVLRAVREAGAPNVPEFFGADFRPDGTAVLAFARAPGADLATLPPLGLAAAGVGRQLFATLAALHAAGIAHCDVKPENVVFDPATGAAALVDFGSAHVGPGPGPATGTVLFFPPEVPDAYGPVSLSLAEKVEHDVWAAALTVFEAASGRFPFDIAGAGEEARAVRGTFRPSGAGGLFAPLDEILGGGPRPPAAALAALFATFN